MKQVGGVNLPDNVPSETNPKPKKMKAILLVSVYAFMAFALHTVANGMA